MKPETNAHTPGKDTNKSKLLPWLLACLLLSTGSFFLGRMTSPADASPTAKNKTNHAATPIHQTSNHTTPTNARPKIWITSPNINILYNRCGNIIEAHGFNSIAAMGTGIYADGVNKFTVVPTGFKPGDTYTLTLQDGDQAPNGYQEEFKYTLLPPPLPTLQMRVNGRVYNGTYPISKRSKIEVEVLADPTFKTHYPKDARYFITKIDVLAARSLGAPTKVASYPGPTPGGSQKISIQLGEALKMDVPGTKVFFKVASVYRRTYTNKKEVVPFSEMQKALGVIIK